MKILNIFIDMLGADFIRLGNEQANYTRVDEVLRKVGGTFYTKCYSPAPDTPRSTACMWTGLYPKDNGCDNRLKYPRRFCKTSINMWESLKSNGYKLDAYIRETDNEIGMLPEGFQSIARGGNINDFIANWVVEENSFSFFYIPDLHRVLDVYGYTPRQFVRGTDLVAKLLNTIFKKYNADFFDYILIYSDHGFRYDGIKKEHLLDEDRVRTLMFLRKKGDTSLVFDSELRSNLDVFPTVLECAGLTIPDDIEGKSLLGEGHEFVLLEDHDDFSVRLSQSIEHWAVFTKNNKYWLECSGNWEYAMQDDDFDKEYYMDLVIKKMNDYEINSKLWLALHIYDGNKCEDISYSDGTIVKKPFYRKKGFIIMLIILKKIRGLF